MLKYIVPVPFGKNQRAFTVRMPYASLLSPIEAERTAHEVAYLMKQPLCRTCSTTEQKTITHCFLRRLRAKLKGYAEVEKSRVVVAPNYNPATYSATTYIISTISTFSTNFSYLFSTKKAVGKNPTAFFCNRRSYRLLR